MDKGYIENGFIVDLTNAKKTSEIIYELSRVLDMPESKGKHICLKLGSVALSQSELTSIKALVELMESQLAYISTSSTETLESATALGIKISEFTNAVEAPTFEQEEKQDSTEEQSAKEENSDEDNVEDNNEVVLEQETVVENEPTPEVSSALDNIFGEEVSSQKAVEPEDVSESNKVGEILQHDDTIVDSLEKIDDEDKEVVDKITETEKLPTLYIRKTIRSGQSISSDGNIIVIGDVNPGSEIIAKGDITVWGILGGIAHAGSDGNEYARIRALKLNPVQIRIGDVFARRPDTINLPYIQKSCEYTPEEAFTYKGNIVIRKIHDEN